MHETLPGTEDDATFNTLRGITPGEQLNQHHTSKSVNNVSLFFSKKPSMLYVTSPAKCRIVNRSVTFNLDLPR